MLGHWLALDGRCGGRYRGDIFSGLFKWRWLTQPQFVSAEHHDTGRNECGKDRKRDHTGASWTYGNDFALHHGFSRFELNLIFAHSRHNTTSDKECRMTTWRKPDGSLKHLMYPA
jgi:hypothetical protein